MNISTICKSSRFQALTEISTHCGQNLLLFQEALLAGSRQEGGVKVCGDAVFFWRGFAEIFIFTCGISVLLDYAVRGLKKVWVTVIGDREVPSAVLFTGILSSASLVFVLLT